LKNKEKQNSNFEKFFSKTVFEEETIEEYHNALNETLKRINSADEPKTLNNTLSNNTLSRTKSKNMLLPMSQVVNLSTEKANTMVYKTFTQDEDEYGEIQFHDVKSSSRLAFSEHKQTHFNQHSACSYNVSSNGENSFQKFDDELLFQDQEQTE
jgi:hypothetical protein